MIPFNLQPMIQKINKNYKKIFIINTITILFEFYLKLNFTMYRLLQLWLFLIQAKTLHPFESSTDGQVYVLWQHLPPSRK